MRMIKLTFTGFGGFSVAVDAKAVTNFPTNRVRALLAYLLLEADRVHSRHALCGLFWPEYPQRDALRNLRDALYRLRQTLDHAQSNLSAELLTVTRQDVQFHAANVDVDVLRFEALLTNGAVHGCAQPVMHQSELTQLAAAVALYQGELLAGFSLNDAPAFEEWLLGRREYLHMRALAALQTLTQAYEAQEEYAEAQRFAQQSLALDPCREASYQTLMRLAVRLGRPEQAVLYYNRARKMLRDELGVDPAAETEELMGQIRRGRFDQGTRTHAVVGDDAPAPRPAVENNQGRETPAHHTSILRGIPHLEAFWGRQAELLQLEQWLVHDRCRLVAILGIGGIGKTSLAAQCVWALAGKLNDRNMETEPLALGLFDHIFWRSLVNAPPLGELLPPLLQALSDQQLVHVPEGLDEQLRLLMGYLYDKRVLLVLDNLESILEPEQAGVYRSGYEPYDQLIEQMATLGHQSCLLLTSREQPRRYARLAGDSPLVRSLQLEGLDPEAGQALLAQRGLRGKSDEEALLITRYSGNPLALKLVADTVDELFGGDISEFLRDETPVFDDIRTVLDQQFTRLSAFEQEVLFWLAIEREPTPLSQLRQNLLHASAQRFVIEALHALQRRALIDHTEAGFVLQNVIVEYLSDRLIETINQELVSGELVLCHRIALLKAQSRAYVRQSQARMILVPLGKRLLKSLGPEFNIHIQQILADLRQAESRTPSYAAGNILNLLLQVGVDLTGYDFSRLNLWQVFLQGLSLHKVDFTGADLTGARFSDIFDAVCTIAYSPNGKLIAIGTLGGEIRVWQTADHTLEVILQGHQDAVWTMAFCPDSRMLASGSGDQTVRLWDLGTGQYAMFYTATPSLSEQWCLAQTARRFSVVVATRQSVYGACNRAPCVIV